MRFLSVSVVSLCLLTPSLVSSAHLGHRAARAQKEFSFETATMAEKVVYLSTHGAHQAAIEHFHAASETERLSPSVIAAYKSAMQAFVTIAPRPGAWWESFTKEDKVRCFWTDSKWADVIAQYEASGEEIKKQSKATAAFLDAKFMLAEAKRVEEGGAAGALVEEAEDQEEVEAEEEKLDTDDEFELIDGDGPEEEYDAELLRALEESRLEAEREERKRRTRRGASLSPDLRLANGGDSHLLGGGHLHLGNGGDEIDEEYLKAIQASIEDNEKRDALGGIEPPHPLYPGIQSMGFNCYADALLQALFYIAPLRNMVFECAAGMNSYDPDTAVVVAGAGSYGYVPKKPYLSPMLAGVFTELLDSVGTGAPAVSIRGFLQAFVDKHADSFTFGQQEDAFEFMVKIISDLENEAHALGIGERFDSVVKARAVKATLWMERDFDPEVVPFLQQHQRQGLREKTEQSLTNLAILNVPIPVLDDGSSKGYFDLVDLFQTLFQAERLTEAEAVKVDDLSNIKVRAWTKLDYQSWPTALIVTLGRFAADKIAGRPLKNDVPVHYPARLDLREFGAPVRYRLHAVVVHSGTAGVGHYTSFIRLPVAEESDEANEAGSSGQAREAGSSSRQPGFLSASSSSAMSRVPDLEFHLFNDQSVTLADAYSALDVHYGQHFSHELPRGQNAPRGKAADRLKALQKLYPNPQDLAAFADGMTVEQIQNHLETLFIRDAAATPCAYILVYVRGDASDEAILAELPAFN